MLYFQTPYQSGAILILVFMFFYNFFLKDELMDGTKDYDKKVITYISMNISTVFILSEKWKKLQLTTVRNGTTVLLISG